MVVTNSAVQATATDITQVNGRVNAAMSTAIDLRLHFTDADSGQSHTVTVNYAGVTGLTD